MIYTLTREFMGGLMDGLQVPVHTPARLDPGTEPTIPYGQQRYRIVECRVPYMELTPAERAMVHGQPSSIDVEELDMIRLCLGIEVEDIHRRRQLRRDRSQ